MKMARSSEQYNDTERLVSCNMRSVGPRHIFIVIGAISVCLVIALLFMIDNVNSSGQQTVDWQHKSIEYESKVENRHFYEISKNSHENVRKRAISNENINEQKSAGRFKRQAELNPIDTEIHEQIIRQKRLSEHLQQVKQQFERCRELQSDKKECEKFYREWVEISEALNKELRMMGDIANAERRGEMSQFPSSVADPRHEFNQDDKLLQKVKGFTSYPFHEDLNNRRIDLWTVDEPSKKAPEQPPFPPPRTNPSVGGARDNEKIVPLKSPNFDPSGQILQLCDQINRQGPRGEQTAQVTNLPGPTSSGFVTNNAQSSTFNSGFQSNFQPAPQVQQQQPQPQPFATPPIFYRSNPVCYYPPPVPPPVSLGQSLFMPQQFVGTATSNTAANRFVLVNGNTHQFGTTSPSGQGFVQVVNQPMARSEEAPANETYYCPYSAQNQAAQGQSPQNKEAQVQPPQGQIPQSPQDSPKFSPKSAPQGFPADSFYASFANRLGSLNVTNPFNVCKSGETSCMSSNQCISNDKWCDNVVDCTDSSDETSCSCTARLNSDKLCDGYLDCPLGTDEIGCFDCDRRSYSCFHNADEYQQAKFSTDKMCYTLLQKCDGFSDCENSKDEEDCSMLIRDVGLHTTFMVPHTEGILYRNYRGRWFPVCDGPQDWAREACASETGEFSDLPEIEQRVGILPGPFISKISSDSTLLSRQIRFFDFCPANAQSRNQIHVRARCPEMKCGVTPTGNGFSAPRFRIRDERTKRNEHLRIVGGDRSGPHNWPYIIAMYKDGRFHCGGTIYTNRWIITAAHCVQKAQNHYYEVHAGLLRRFSYAPEVQIAKVIQIIVNDGFDRSAMMNDVALLRLEKPLLFNRWVRPICLPTPERVTVRDDPNWMFGPSPGTICTVVGWGALTEGGSSPDNLEEVNVPIMKTCKDIVDINGNEICAGEKDGGHDACQGDSGGPLVCRSNADPNETYLAGIVSHGEGCARRGEPGVYTRVALYVDWIDGMINSDLSITAKSTKTICPGFTCVWSGRCISHHYRCNGQIDCLGGEDELNCAFNPVGSARKRVHRQNAQSELPDGGGNSDIPHSKADIPAITTELPIVLTTVEQIVETTTTTTLPLTIKPILTTPEPEVLPATPEPEVLPATQLIEVPNTTLPPKLDLVTDPGPSPLDPEDDFKPTKENDRRNTTLNIEDFVTTPSKELIVPKPIQSDKIFECRKIPQKISMDLRCDGMSFDCEDGTDEEDCTCRESLHKKYSQLICDGDLNCVDGTDEDGCVNCTNDEHICRQSKKCIPKTSRCNGIDDCNLKEDELDCVALTDGKSVLMDFDLRPKLNHKGIVCENVNGTWAVKCVNRVQLRKNAQLAGQICFTLGFSGYSFHNVSRVDENGEIKTRRPDQGRNRFLNPMFDRHAVANIGIGSGRRIFKRDTDSNDALESHIEEIVGAPARKQCFALYLECVPHSIIPIVEPPAEPPVIDITTEIPKPIAPPNIEPPKDPGQVKPVVPPKPVKPVLPKPVKPNHSKPVEPHHSKPVEHHHPIPVEPPPPPRPTKIEPPVAKILMTNFKAPWTASVYVDGSFKCIGILLAQYWVLVEDSCIEDVDLESNVIVIVLGKSQNVLNVKAPISRFHRVNCMSKLKQGPGSMLYLPDSVQFDRYTLPTYVPSSINVEDKDCLAVAHGELGGFVSIPVIRNETDCPNEEKSCYQAEKPLEDVKCKGFDGAEYVAVVCRDEKNNTYYPISVLSLEDGLCSFNDLIELNTLEPSYNHLQMISTWPFCGYAKEAKCDGHKCPLGACIPKERICDKKPDCHDGSDEEPSKCECAPDEFRCGDGTCVSKSKFCDKHVDCKDAADEPQKCTCRDYLALTDIRKICDGIPNCADKTDEQNCPCRSSSFKCTDTWKREMCIPVQFVCDGQVDCGSGEDEQTCYETDQTPVHTYYYRGIERTTEDWQTMCFEKPHKPTQGELIEICSNLGYNNATDIWYQLIDTDQKPTETNRNHINVVATNMFSNLRLNDNFNLTSFHPRQKTSQTNNIDEKNCFQLEINCES